MEKRLKSAIDLRPYLEGSWDITRSIDDRRNDAPGRLTGRAVFIPEDNGLHYQESGRLKMAAFDDNVHQRYLFRFPEKHCATVSFTDGRSFHDLDLSTGTWQAHHVCGPDIYDGEFELDGENAWRSQWTIHGPRKDMTIRTCYTRAGSNKDFNSAET